MLRMGSEREQEWEQDGPLGGCPSTAVRCRKLRSQVRSGGIEKWMDLRHIFKGDPIGFHGGVVIVCEKKRIKGNCQIFVLNNYENGFAII